MALIHAWSSYLFSQAAAFLHVQNHHVCSLCRLRFEIFHPQFSIIHHPVHRATMAEEGLPGPLSGEREHAVSLGLWQWIVVLWRAACISMLACALLRVAINKPVKRLDSYLKS